LVGTLELRTVEWKAHVSVEPKDTSQAVLMVATMAVEMVATMAVEMVDERAERMAVQLGL
jgi:Ca2+/H+ antiporter